MAEHGDTAQTIEFLNLVWRSDQPRTCEVLLVIAEPCRNIGKYTLGDILAYPLLDPADRKGSLPRALAAMARAARQGP